MASGVRRHVTGSYDVVLFALFILLRLLIFIIYICFFILSTFLPHVQYSSLDILNKIYLISFYIILNIIATYFFL